MSRFRRQMRYTATVVVAFGALVAVGCAKDEPTVDSSATTPVTASSEGADTTAPGTSKPVDGDVCAMMDEFVDLGEDEMERGLDLIADIQAASPDDIADEWDVVTDTFVKINELDAEADFAEFVDLVSDPDFQAAAENIDEFAEDECGEDLGLSDLIDVSGTTDGTDGTDAKKVSIDDVQAYLEDNYDATAWWPVFDDATSWTRSGVSSTVEWTVTLSADGTNGVAADELVEGCQAMADYLDENEGAPVRVTITDSSDKRIVFRVPFAPCAEDL